MKALLVVVAVAVLSGCATVGYVGKFVKGYCGSTTELERSAIRARVAEATYPHVVRVECN